MDFTIGEGELGGFLLRRALLGGARPVATGGLPAIGEDWIFSEDQDGVVVRAPRESFRGVQAFLRKAFGLPAQKATGTMGGGMHGWYSRRATGVRISFGYQPDHTQVIILHPRAGKMTGPSQPK